MNWIEHSITFMVMWMIGIVFNPMNVLAYRWSDLYLSKTLLYSGFFMASIMAIAHSCLHYGFGHMELHECLILFGFGLMGVGLSVIGLRYQIAIGLSDWMQRMIPHHSTAITTSTQLLQNNPNLSQKDKKLAQNIIKTQEREIIEMKTFLHRSTVGI